MTVPSRHVCVSQILEVLARSQHGVLFTCEPMLVALADSQSRLLQRLKPKTVASLTEYTVTLLAKQTDHKVIILT